MKVLLILVDGMRPDALPGVAEAEEMRRLSAFAPAARTVFPSVTLPCHMSLFHSVDPDRHGITTNTYMPQVRPIQGLCERIHAAEKSASFFFNWEELRDLSRPGSLREAVFVSGHEFGWEEANRRVTDAAVRAVSEGKTDFIFLYLGWVDEAGHASGWMGEEYMNAVRSSWRDIARTVAAIPGDEEWSVIVTADHGGHARGHGTKLPEDMTIPIFFRGKNFAPGTLLEDVSIKDIAPTAAALLGVKPAPEWEGKSLA